MKQTFNFKNQINHRYLPSLEKEMTEQPFRPVEKDISKWFGIRFTWPGNLVQMCCDVSWSLSSIGKKMMIHLLCIIASTKVFVHKNIDNIIMNLQQWCNLRINL